MYKVYVIFAIAFLFVTCATTTNVLIQTDTPGAKVYLGSKYIGDTEGIEGSASLVIKAPNRQSNIVRLEKDGKSKSKLLFTEVKIINIVGGVFLLVPFIWTIGPIAVQTINLF